MSIYKGKSRASFEFLTIVAMAIILLVLPLMAEAGGLKITEKVDEFTQVTSHEAKVKVCTRSAMAPCATFYLAWFENDVDNVLVIAEQHELVSNREILFRLDGQIVRYNAANAFTDVEINHYNGQRFTDSRSGYFVRIDTLRAVAEVEDSAVVRLAGINNASDFDFRKKATAFGKRPFQRLGEFIEYVDAKRINQTAATPQE